MRRMLAAFGVCDSHSHVYGPFDKFPLAESRTFTPPESPIESLEAVWSSHGIDRAVLIQGSACGTDHAALLRAIAPFASTGLNICWVRLRCRVKR